MRTKSIIIVSGLLLLPAVYAQSEFRDPFSPRLPVKKTISEKTRSVVEEYIGVDADVELPSLAVEGVLWGSQMPQAIIEGEVYRVGDRLRGVGIDAEVSRIEKSKVFINYGGRTHELSVKKEEEKK